MGGLFVGLDPVSGRAGYAVLSDPMLTPYFSGQAVTAVVDEQ